MAHQLAENPWVIDSGTNNANYSITTKRVKITGIEWCEPVSTDDECILLSENDDNSLIWSTIASANVNAVVHNPPGWVKGLYLRKLDSGKLVIAFE